MKKTKNIHDQQDVKLLAQIVEHLPLGLMILDSNGKVVLMNRFQADLSRIPTEAVIGRNFHDTWTILVNETPRYGEKYWKMIHHGQPFTYVFHQHKIQFGEGTVSGIARGTPLPSGQGFIMMHLPIKAIKEDKEALDRLNRQLMESEQALLNMVDSSPNAVITAIKDGFITSVNQTAGRIFGGPGDALLGKPVSMLFEDLGSLFTIHRMIDKATGIETECVRTDGSRFPARVQISDIRSPGEEDHHKQLFVIADISHVREIEMSLQNRLEFEKLLSKMSAAFINVSGEEIDNIIQKFLEHLVEFMGADRAVVVRLLEDGETLQVAYSYAREGVRVITVGITAPQTPYISGIIMKGEVAAFSHPDDLPEKETVDRKLYHALKVTSLVSVPIMAAGSLVGAISISTQFERMSWHEELINRLRLVGEIFANALLRRESEIALQSAFTEIRALKDQMEAERNYLRDEIKLEHNFEEIIGSSQTLKYALYKVEKVAPTDATVLIQGETGTGKELIARAIHNASLRREKPLIKVNCATLPETLIESELFGHERGAFTSADSRQIGRFELAHGGTLFLDEIGELPLQLQPKLLRAIQDGEFERLGSSKTIKVDVRIIAATNRDLEKEVGSGKFRQDLWYRLNVFPITVPPLRRRKTDIPLLVNWFVNLYTKKIGKTISSVPRETMDMLKHYDWPGNIRELENWIERAVINTSGTALELVDNSVRAKTGQNESSEGKTLVELEREHILKILKDTRWKVHGQDGAAEILGINPSTLRGRMRKLNIKRPV